MRDILRRLKEQETQEKQNWLSLIKFYNSQLDKHVHVDVLSFFYRLREKAVNEVEACDIQLQFLDFEIMEND